MKRSAIVVGLRGSKFKKTIIPRRISVTAVTALLVVGLSACGSSSTAASTSTSTTQAAGQSMTQVTIGINAPVASEVQPLLAQQSGIFKKLGINATVKVIPASELLADISAGKVQFGAFGAPQPEEAAMNGAPLKWLAVWQSTSTLQLIAGPGITSISDLKGQSIGETVPGSLIDVLARLALTRVNLPASEVKFAPLQTTSAVASSFVAGTIQAGILSPPQSTLAVKDRPGSTVLLNFGSYYKWPQGGLAAYMPWVNSHQAATAAIVKGIAEAINEFHQNPTVTKAAILSMSPTASAASINGAYQSTLPVLRTSIVPSLTTEKFVLQTLQSLYPGKYPKANPSDAASFIDDTYAQAAMKSLGTLG